MGAEVSSVTLGGRFIGLSGKVYTVIGVEGSKVHVRFAEGGEGLIRRPEHMMAQRRVEVEQAQNRKFTRREIQARSMKLDLYTVGFLVVRGYLWAEMPPDFEKGFVELYHKLAGEDPKHYNVTLPNANKWAITTQIHFGGTAEEIDVLDFGELEIHRAWEGDEKRWGVYCNDFYWALISLGFYSGREKHDPQKIRSQLSGSHVHTDEFDRGLVAAGAVL